MIADPIRAHFEAHAASWDTHAPPDLDARLGRLLAPFSAQLRTAHRVLELGTGTGACIPHLRAHSPRAQLVSLDLAHAMLVRARQRGAGAHLAQADAQALPFPSANGKRGFDWVVCHNSFPHFQDKPRALWEVWRVLRRGGHLLIVHHLSRKQVNAIHQRIGPPIADDRLPTAREMERLFFQCGYGQIEVEDAATHYLAHAIRP